MRKNKIRGFMGLRVWKDAIALYRLTAEIVKPWPNEWSRITRNHLASVDSVHRNIAEGYCRKSVKEYLQFLSIAIGSLGESVSAMHAYVQTGHLEKASFEDWDALAFKLENGLIKLVASLERKRDAGDWSDSYLSEEPELNYFRQNPVQEYRTKRDKIPMIHQSNYPFFQ